MPLPVCCCEGRARPSLHPVSSAPCLDTDVRAVLLCWALPCSCTPTAGATCLGNWGGMSLSFRHGPGACLQQGSSKQSGWRAIPQSERGSSLDWGCSLFPVCQMHFPRPFVTCLLAWGGHTVVSPRTALLSLGIVTQWSVPRTGLMDGTSGSPSCAWKDEMEL